MGAATAAGPIASRFDGHPSPYTAIRLYSATAVVIIFIVIILMTAAAPLWLWLAADWLGLGPVHITQRLGLQV